MHWLIRDVTLHSLTTTTLKSELSDAYFLYASGSGDGFRLRPSGYVVRSGYRGVQSHQFTHFL